MPDCQVCLQEVTLSFPLLYFFIMRAQTQTGSKVRSINIQGRSVARRRREQMNDILIDRPGKGIGAFFQSLACTVDSRIFFYADQN